jgi:ankyrin repeat protein
VHGEPDSVLALIGHGAKVDLPVAAALGRGTECERLLSTATPEERHLALAVAAQFGHARIVEMMLDAGEDPDRYNPPGGHSHATPLHQAAGFGHEAVVRLLVGRGARLDQRDVLWNAAPVEWAEHEGRSAVEEYLRGLESPAAKQ